MLRFRYRGTLMTNRLFLALLSLPLMACALRAAEQPQHGHGGPALFVVHATGANVRPASGSTATATGAFTIDPTQRTLTYDLTYHGLTAPPRSIALHNFCDGGNSERVHTLCGDGASPCPAAIMDQLEPKRAVCATDEPSSSIQ